eukprot:174674-Alexandrium_andersonii.AAC.1
MDVDFQSVEGTCQPLHRLIFAAQMFSSVDDADARDSSTSAIKARRKRQADGIAATGGWVRHACKSLRVGGAPPV